MSRLTKERELEIRNRVVTDTDETWRNIYTAQDIGELLAEIDELRGEKEALIAREFHSGQQYWNQRCATDEFQLKFKKLEKEFDALKVEIEQLKTDSKIDLEFMHNEYDELAGDTELRRELLKDENEQLREELKKFQKLYLDTLIVNKKLQERVAALHVAIQGVLTYDPMIDTYKIKEYFKTLQLALDEKIPQKNAVAKLRKSFNKRKAAVLKGVNKSPPTYYICEHSTRPVSCGPCTECFGGKIK